MHNFCRSAGQCGGCNVYIFGREGSAIEEADWIQAVKNGGPEHFRPFVQTYGPYLYRTIYAVLQSPQDAEDVTQEALLQIYRSLPSCRLDGFKTWMTRIAVNKAIDFKRSKQRRPEQLTALEDLEGMSSIELNSSPAAERLVLEKEDNRRMKEQLARLPANYRDVITAYYMEEKSYEQIAADTGLERKSVESRLYRARNWIKRHWRKEDFE